MLAPVAGLSVGQISTGSLHASPEICVFSTASAAPDASEAKAAESASVTSFFCMRGSLATAEQGREV